MSEPARKTPLYVTMEEPITIGMLCRCLLALLVGGLLGLSLFTLGAQLDAKEVDSSAVACVVLSCLLIPSMASSEDTAHPAVLFSVGTGALLVCLPLSFTNPAHYLLPWLGGAAFLGGGTVLLIRFANPSSTPGGHTPTLGEHAWSAVAGLLGGLLAYLPLMVQNMATKLTGGRAEAEIVGAILLPCVLTIGATVLVFYLIAMRSCLGIFIMVASCLTTAVVVSSAKQDILGAMVFGMTAISAIAPLLGPGPVEPPVLRIQALPG